MKIFLKILVIVLFFIGVIQILHSCKKEELPTLSTSTITNITATSATGGGNVTSDGNAGITSRGVCWSLNVNPIISDSKTADGNGTGQFVSNLSGLSAGSTYHVRAYATNSVGTAYGADLSFATLGKAPECLTQTATNITSSGATLNGTVNANYLSTTVTFEYGMTTSYRQTITATQSPVTGNSITNGTAEITDLLAGTTYHFRVKAINSFGTTYGNDMSFTTSGQAPAATTQSATNITVTSATLNGLVNANYASTVVTFDYGTTTTYGSSIAATPSPVTGNNSTSVSADISGLNSGTTYHFRTKAVSSLGTTHGDDMIFTTLSVPAINTTAITGITSNSAISGGNITFDGATAIITRGVCWSTNANPTAALNTKTADGTGTGSFISSITGLAPGTLYHVRAYATNSIGTAYGNDLTFTTLAVVPTVTTSAVSAITQTSATTGGNVTDNGGANVTARGVCWGTSANPTINEEHTTDGTGIGSFTSNMKCLSFATTYYVRAYATNSAGTAYGDQRSFATQGTNPIIFNSNLTYGSVSDVDGNCYKTIQIGTQTWMAENLKTTMYNDGTSILNVTDNTEWIWLTSDAYSDYNNQPSYSGIYGRLYNCFAVNTNKLCPANWHVPTYAEWNILIDFLGGEEVAGDKLKESGTTHWLNPNTGINDSGLTTLPGGVRWESNGFYENLGHTGSYWTSTRMESTATKLAWLNEIFHDQPNIEQYYDWQTRGLSVRCVKDN